MANVSEAIEASIDENRTVKIFAETEAECTALCDELRVECDESNSYSETDNSEVHEFWGSKGADEWRVHVVLR